MSRCIIHVGMHKTGTSSIQRSLNGFADASHAYYEDGRSSGNHSRVMRELVGSSGFDNRPFGKSETPAKRRGRESGKPAVIASVLRYVEGLNGRDLLLSGEGTMFHPSRDLKALQRFFSGSFSDAIVVAYVRPPAAYITSLVQQVIKGGSIGSFNVNSAYPNYHHGFAKFDEAFGGDNVHLWKFDPKAFPGGCVVRDFCARLDIDLPADRIVRVNESLSRQVTALLYTYRKFGHELGALGMSGPENLALVQKLSVLGGDKFRLSPDLVRPVLEHNRVDIEWMEARLGASLQEDLGDHRPGDVRGEEDLLRPDPAVVEKLLVLLGDRAPKGVRGTTPEEVALLVHALRGKPAGRSRTAVREDPPVAQGPFRGRAVNNREEGALPTAGERRSAGKVMRATPDGVLGWVAGADLEHPVEVALLVNGEEVARMLADRPRPALKARGIHPTGRCGFAFRFEADKTLRPGDQVVVRPIGADFPIGNSPCVVSLGPGAGAEDS